MRRVIEFLDRAREFYEDLFWYVTDWIIDTIHDGWEWLVRENRISGWINERVKW